MLEVKKLSMIKKRKKELLSKLEALDKNQSGEISIEDFNWVSTEVNILLDEEDYEFLKAKFTKQGKVSYKLAIKDYGFKMIDSAVHWCLNSNPKNK